MKLDCQRGVGAYCIVLREILEANVGSFYKIFARLYIDVACPVDIGKYGFVARAYSDRSGCQGLAVGIGHKYM